ncbi:TPA: hypothetical protein ACRND3_006471 [Pseudomonas aeruginosa]|uniref:hypothetical protein n=1 Tax=Pseudomonas aeruginosa TaxID=287 RepID=UPI0003D1F87B|nr:hypothetical protein [Pseudomonas aeruginosa]AHB57783.1 hypothetical protein U769_22762 [Pseudomonas aeruginosa MTB-1]ELM3823622.1 hypothetical protein [Pseudomonas aeruginosa]MBF1865822.1 hypothetical protein [Pseudomonas aeruginosa]MBH4327646.1 hypothetical protein [Pseudomonas aeruginosa]MBH8744060.1 hypothetical protein [Pseudomonas aeruginosa]
MEYINFLGYYYGEEELNLLLNALAIAEVPVLPRGDTDTYLLKESAGIELTLSDAESLKFSERDYPDGALVLTNVRYYGKKIGEFSIFQGALPYGIKFGQTKPDLISLLGEPEWKNPDESRLRWVRGSHRIHVTLDNDGKVVIFSGGLPF